MLRIIFFIIVLGAIILGFDWLMDQPGRVTIELPGYVIEPTLAQIAVFLAILAILSILIWTLFRFIVNGPESLSLFMSARRERQGLDALRNGLVAIGTGDTKLADAMSRKAHNLLGPQPLTQLLDAQTALAKQDHPHAIASFEAMRAGTETQLIGLNGLFDIAVQQKDLKAAYALAEEAYALSSNLKWAANAVLEGRVAAQQWDMALDALQALKQHGHMAKAECQLHRAVLLTAKAAATESKDPVGALKLAEEAHSLDPALIPAAVIAGRIASARNDVTKATRILERAWKKNPHPDIAEIYAHARSGDSANDRLTRVKNLMKKRASHAEAPVALARAAIECGAFDEAREALSMIQEENITQRVCALHAQLEDADGQNKGRVREWLARTVRAPADPVWIADGVVSPQWCPQSPVTGKIGVFEWKIPEKSDTGLVIASERAKSLFDSLPIFDEHDNEDEETVLLDRDKPIISTQAHEIEVEDVAVQSAETSVSSESNIEEEIVDLKSSA